MVDRHDGSDCENGLHRWREIAIDAIELVLALPRHCLGWGIHFRVPVRGALKKIFVLN